MSAGTPTAAPIRLTSWKPRSTSRNTQSGDTMVVSVNARTAGKLTINVLGDRLLTTQTVDVKQGTAAGQDSRRQGLGHRRLCAGDAAPSARCRRAADAGPRDRAEMVRHRQEDPHAGRSLSRRRRWCGPDTTLKIPVKLGGLNPGEDAKIVVAAVDVGILNLTNYKPPAPDDYYLGQRRMTLRNPRPLWAVDRRHAGHARPAPDRRRFGRR